MYYPEVCLIKCFVLCFCAPPCWISDINPLDLSRLTRQVATLENPKVNPLRLVHGDLDQTRTIEVQDLSQTKTDKILFFLSQSHFAALPDIDR